MNNSETTLIKVAFTVFIIFNMALANTQTIPSFSGAEGFGAVTVGGRGGEVYHVTNLDNSGPGSFRAACEATGPRTVVFDVSGIIQLTEEVQITNPYITIAGQTAPGDGIIIAGATVNMTGQVNDILIRYLRFRRSYDKDGPFPKPNTSSAGQCLVGMSVSKNLMMDHISASWGTDENFSMYRCQLDNDKLIPTKNITIQWCLISEALNPAGHAFANTWGGQGSNQHHNLMACNVGRNPSISFSHFMDYRNNVIFNWRDRSMDGAGKEAHLNVINNYYKPGPATGYNWNWSAPLPELKVRIVQPEIRTWNNWEALGLDRRTRYAGPGVIGKWYVDGNIMEGHPEITNDNWEGKSLVDGKYYTGVQWSSLVKPYPGIGPEIGDTNMQWKGDNMADHLEWVKVDAPHTHVEFPENPLDPYDGDNGEIFVMPDLPKIATQTANDAYLSVLAGSGAILPVRDAVDIRTIEMAKTGVATAGSRKNGIIDHPDEVGGYPIIEMVKRPSDWDTDQDGMPDTWEEARKLNPNDAKDRNDDYDLDGYTNLEEYLNEIGAFNAVQAIIWDGEIDERYARIENWDLAFQPSRLDTAIIRGATVKVDAIDQHAGILHLTDCSILNITDGSLDVAKRLNIDSCSITNVDTNGSLIATDIVNNGIFRLFGDARFTLNGTFTNNDTLDVSKWKGSLPSGIINNGTIIDSLGIIPSLPSVTITSPTNHDVFTNQSNIIINADISNSIGTISSVEFFHGSTSLGIDNTSPYSTTWNNVPAGKHSISARVTNGRIATTSSIVNISITDFPTVAITSPLNKDKFDEHKSISISADASDSDGTIANVEFFQGSTSLGVDYSSPYSFKWDSVPAGDYSITAIASDNMGAKTTSSAVEFKVSKTNSVSIISQINETKLDVKFYPVPTYNILNIEFSQELTEVLNINLFDITGKIIRSNKAYDRIYTLDMSGIPEGIYMIKISGTMMNKVLRITKQKP